MNIQKPQFYFLLTILLGTAIVAFFILRPFLYAILLAMVFVVISQPIHKKILKLVHNNEGLASLFTMLFIAIVTFIPLIFIGTMVFQETKQLYLSLSGDGGRTELIHIIENFMVNLRKTIPMLPEQSVDLNQYAKQLVGWIADNIGALFSNIASALASSFIFLISLYYLLKDGKKFKQIVIEVSPLTDNDDRFILKKLEDSISSIVKGSLTVALAQGSLVGLGFAIFGIPNPILWGSVAAIAVLIPSIGTALVMVPAIIFLFITSHFISAIGLLIWGILIVGLVDNFLNPKLVGRGMQLHPLIVLLSVLGGLLLFGPIGFLLGPLTVGLLISLVEIYFSLIKQSSK